MDIFIMDLKNYSVEIYIILRVETFVSWTIRGLKDFAKKKHHENYGLKWNFCAFFKKKNFFIFGEKNFRKWHWIKKLFS